jgi:anti-sigma factor RsiW
MSEARLKGCPEWRVMLHGFVDGEFDPVHASQFQDHLATCPGCRAAMECGTAVYAVFRASVVRVFSRRPSLSVSQIVNLIGNMSSP